MDYCLRGFHVVEEPEVLSETLIVDEDDDNYTGEPEVEYGRSAEWYIRAEVMFEWYEPYVVSYLFSCNIPETAWIGVYRRVFSE